MTPAIRFFVLQEEDYLAKLEDEKLDMITIKVKAEQDQPDSKLNQQFIKFQKIQILMQNGLAVAEVQLKLLNEFFLPQGLTGPEDVDKRINAFKRICVDEARTSVMQEVNFARLDFITKYMNKDNG